MSLGEIEVRALDDSTSQIVFRSWNPHIDNVFEQIDKEIIRFWPVAAAADVSRILSEKSKGSGKQEVEPVPAKPKRPEKPPEGSNHDVWFKLLP